MDLGPVAEELGLGDDLVWQAVASTEDERFVADPQPPALEPGPAPTIRFERPGVLVLGARRRPTPPETGSP
jgi:hypothetical protein